MTDWHWAALAVCLAGLGAGLALERWLGRGDHLRLDEAPRVRQWWPVIPVGAALPGLLVLAQPALHGLLLACLAPLLLALAAIDLDVMRLPDRLTGALFLGGVVGVLLVAVVRHDWGPLGRALVCALALGAFYYLLALLSRGGMGAGDVKLAPGLGLLLGWFSPAHVVAATLSAFVLGALWGLARLALGRGRELAFGPSMVLGAVAVWLAPLVGLVR